MEDEELARMLEAHSIWLESNGKQGQQAQGTHDFSGKELQNARLSKARLRKSNFAHANLTDADLSKADLSGAVFTGATLKKANLGGANLIEANLENAVLTAANFQGAALRRARFANARLGGEARLRETDLRNADLEKAVYLQTVQLAGADVAGAKLPIPIAAFDGLKTIAEATSNAQKMFIAMLSGCLYCWLTIGTTTDVALLTNSASSPLPIIGTALPVVGFYIVAPIVLLAIYFYFHLNMQRLWEGLADLPAVFPDGRSLDKRADPWLLNGLVSAHFARLRRQRPSLSRIQQWLSILLAWWVVPATLFVFWGRFIARHDKFGTCLHVALLAAGIGFGGMSYHLARSTLRGRCREPLVWAKMWRDRRTVKKVAGVVAVGVFGALFYLISFAAIDGIPYSRYESDEEKKVTDRGTYSLERLVPRILESIGFNSFASLYEEDISTKPANWTGQASDYVLVKGARLDNADMRYAEASYAFLANAKLRSANLQKANFGRSDLSNAKLSRAWLVQANFSEANLSGADLSGALLFGADLSYGNLSKADLRGAALNNANFERSDLSDAELSHVRLSGVNLTEAKLFRTHLESADLSTAKGLTQRQLSEAIINEHTQLPEHIQR